MHTTTLYEYCNTKSLSDVTMGQYLSLQSLAQVAFGRPYIDVFGAEDERGNGEKEGDKRDEKRDEKRGQGDEKREEKREECSDVVVKVSLSAVRVVSRADRRKSAPRTVTFAPSHEHSLRDL